MPQAAAKSGFEKWSEGISAAKTNPKWDEYDCEVQRAVADFNHHLIGTRGFRPLNWRVIKAMIWVETGANHPEWTTRPMQIGVQGDPGLTSLLSAGEGGELILPPTWQRQLTVGSVRSIPSHNIRAGVGYLFMRLAFFEHKSVSQSNAAVAVAMVRPGDTLFKLAKQHGTTPEIFAALNAGTTTLRPGQELKYRKGAVERVITGWRSISTTVIATRYNGGGDPNYARKLDYVLNVIEKNKEQPCA